jgi:hypothetical protein
VETSGSCSGSQHARARKLDVSAIITEIYTTFANNRQKERVSAWMKLQQDLARNAGDLCPLATSMKDLNSTLADIENMMKGQQGDAGQSPSEYLEDWLTYPQREKATQ